MSRLHQKPNSFQPKIRTFSKVAEEAMLCFCYADVPAVLDTHGLSHLAAHIGVSKTELKQLLDDFARTGNISYGTRRGKPVATPILGKEAI